MTEGEEKNDRLKQILKDGPPEGWKDVPFHPKVRALWEHFAELDKKPEDTSGPFPLLARQALQLDDKLIEYEKAPPVITYFDHFLACPLSVWGGKTVMEMIRDGDAETIHYVHATLRRMGRVNPLESEVERLQEELAKKQHNEDNVREYLQSWLVSRENNMNSEYHAGAAKVADKALARLSGTLA